MPHASPIQKKRIRDILASPETVATVALAILLDEFGTEMLEWEPDTLTLELVSTYNLQPEQLLRDKIWAAATVLTTEQPFYTIEAFNAVSNPFNNEEANFDLMDIPDAAEAAWCVSEMQVLLGTDYRGDLFQPELKSYFRLLLDDEGIFTTPKLLSPAYPAPARPEALNTDPMVEEAIRKREGDAIYDINTYVARKSASLLHQLNNAPLMNADSKWPGILARLMEQTDQQLTSVG